MPLPLPTSSIRLSEALDQIGAAGLLGPLDHLRVGRGEIGGRDGVQILVEQEARHGRRAGVAFAQRHHVAQLLRGQQIGIADRAIIGVVLPLRRSKAAVARLVVRLCPTARRSRNRPIAWPRRAGPPSARRASSASPIADSLAAWAIANGSNGRVGLTSPFIIFSAASLSWRVRSSKVKAEVTGGSAPG